MSSILLVVLGEDRAVVKAHDLMAPRFFNYTTQRPGADDVIVLNPGVPAIASAEFEAYLDDWHEAHRPAGWIQHPAASMKEARSLADAKYLGWRQAQTGGEA